MSYDEHLISMAGGDGETVDQLAAIEARRAAYMRGDTSQQTIFEIVADGAQLLALVREQQAKLDRVEALADKYPYTILGRDIRAAITATEEA